MKHLKKMMSHKACFKSHRDCFIISGYLKVDRDYLSFKSHRDCFIINPELYKQLKGNVSNPIGTALLYCITLKQGVKNGKVSNPIGTALLFCLQVGK